MGKSKGSQRTKGNAKPSSSGRSAELLSLSGKFNFVGFSSSKTPQLLAQEGEIKIDGNFSMVMKKMLKRDSTTRLKAVQEFRDLCDEQDKDTLIGILPFWPRLYVKMALDFDRRIREVTQEANAKLIDKIKRDIAPFLRNIMSVWLLSQCDVYAPAASVARNAFLATFPQEKQSEALMFCKEEIFLYIKECLFEQTPESLSEPNATSEEKENKYILVISGALRGLKLFLSTICSSEKETVVDDIQRIVHENKFWKFAKNKRSQVRVAWYELVSTLCHTVPEVIQGFEHKLGCAVLGCLSESDPIVAPAVWEAALHYIAGFENCWDNIDIHKVVLPELWTLLKGGGAGNASLLFPCLLPFLSKLPVEVIKQRENFFQDFFSSIRESLFLENVTRSTVECNAIITAFMECLQYVLLHISIDCESDAVADDLICNQLFSMVDSSFKVHGTHLPVSKFFPCLGKCIQVLESHISSDCGSDVENISNVLSLFWERITSVCLAVLNGEHLEQHADLVFLAYFFHCLYEPQNFVDKKSKVKFLEKDSEHRSHKSTTTTSSSHAKRTNLFECSVKVSRALYKKLEENFEPLHMRLLTEILSASRCLEIFQELLNDSTPAKDTDEAPLLFFNNVILTWIHRAAENNGMLKDLVDIVLVMCSCSDNAAQWKVLTCCCETEKPEFFKTFLENVLNLRREDKLFSKWLKSPEVNAASVNLFKFVCSFLKSQSSCKVQNLGSYFSPLHSYLNTTVDGEPVVDTKYLEEIVVILTSYLQMLISSSESLENWNHDVLEFMCNAAADILMQRKGNWNLPVVKDMVTEFFNLSLCSFLPLNEMLKEKIMNIWRTSVRELTSQETLSANDTFVASAAANLHTCILCPDTHEMSSHILRTASVLLSELEEMFSEENSDNEEMCESLNDNAVSEIVERILPSDSDWASLKGDLTLTFLPTFLVKRLLYPMPNSDVKSSPESIPPYVTAAQYVSNIIIAGIECGKSSLQEIMTEHVFLQLPHILWAFAYCESHGYLREKDKKKVNTARNLQEYCFNILAFLPKSDAVLFLHRLSDMSLKDSFCWSLPLQNAIEIFIALHAGDILELLNVLQKISESDSPGKCMSRQIVMYYLPWEAKAELVPALVSEALQSLSNDRSEQWNFQVLAEVFCCIQEMEVLTLPAVQEGIILVLQKLLQVRSSVKYEDKNFFLFSMQLAALLSEVIKKCPDIMSSMWNSVLQFLTVSLVSCRRIGDSIFLQVQKLIYCHRCCSLLCDVLLLTDDSEFAAKNFSKNNVHFMADASRNLIFLFLSVSETATTLNVLPRAIEAVLSTLFYAVEFLPPEQVLSAMFSELSSDSAEEKINQVLKKLVPLLTSSVRPVQLGVHTILMKLVGLFPACLKNEKNDDNEEVIRLNPLIEHLKYTSQIVDSMLSDMLIGDCCVVLPYTDAYTYTVAYLFAWNEILEYISMSASQERSSYAMYLESNGLISSLLSSLFRLIPENPALCGQSNTDKDLKGKELLRTVFCAPPLFLDLDRPTAEDLQHVVCNTYYNALKKVPAIVRTWWNNMDKRAADYINRFTSKYVSSLVSFEEILAVIKGNVQCENMTVQACPGSREVVATYTVDGSSIELLIQLPQNYPLSPCTIETRGKVKIIQQQWRHWLMQLTAFLTYQNGSILDGLLLWKKNLDKKFEGIEECLICFFILHATTAELPKRSCPTCKKKFHPSCIHKWFVTSNNATCPLCRNLW